MRSRSGPGQPARRSAATWGGVQVHGAPRVAEEPARTRVHRRHQREPCREHGRPRGARDDDRAVLERLAQHFQRAAVELRRFVEEQHAVVREADLARPRHAAAADQGRVRDGVVRRAERPVRHQARVGRQQARHRVDRRDLQRLVERQRRQEPRQAPRQHRLARAGRPDHQQVVAAGGGDLERPPGQVLAVHVAEVGLVGGRPAARRRGARGRARVGVVQHRDRLRRASRRAAASRPSTIAASAALAAGSSRRREAALARQRRDRAATPRVGSIEPSSDSSPTIRVSAIVGAVDHAGGGQHAQRDRQIERGARLAHVGRREIDGDALQREVEAGIPDRRSRTRSRLSRTLASGRPTSTSDGQPEGDVDLDVDRAWRRDRRGRPTAARPAWLACLLQGAGQVRQASKSVWRIDGRTDGACAARAQKLRRAARRTESGETATRATRADGVDGEALAGADAVRAQPVPLLHRRDAGLEEPRDRRQRVAALHAIDRPAAGRLRRDGASVTSVARSTAGRASAIGVGRSGCAAISDRRRARNDELLARAHARARGQVIGLGQVGAVDAQLARDGGDALARAHGVPVQRAALGGVGARPGAHAKRLGRCPSAPSARSPGRAPVWSSDEAPD